MEVLRMILEFVLFGIFVYRLYILYVFLFKFFEKYEVKKIVILGVLKYIYILDYLY